MSYHSIGEGSSSSNSPHSRKGKEKSNQYSEEQEPLLSSPTVYGSVIPTNHNEEQQQPIEQSHVNPRRQQKTCTYIALIITTFSILVLFSLLWFAPTFAERSVKDGVNFSFQKASILNVTEDNVITMHVTGNIELKSSLYNLQSKFNSLFGTIGLEKDDLQVYYVPQQKEKSSTLMGFITLPSLGLNSASNVTTFDFITQFMIKDTDALTEFCKDAVAVETIMWRVAGPLLVNLGWLPWKVNVDLDKTVELEGMNGLKQTDLKSMVFPGPHPLGGIEVYGTVGIFNPSGVLSLTLGDMDFGIFLPSKNENEKDVQIAVVQAQNADLQGHRMNYFNVTGRTLPIPESEQAQDLMETFLTNYLHGVATEVHVRGSAFGPEDQPDKKHVSDIPLWLREALQHVVLSVPFPGATETDLIQSLELTNIKIDFSPSGNTLISGDAVAMLKKPQEMQFHMDVTYIDPTVFLYLNKDSEKPFATVKPNRPCPASTQEGDGLDIPLGTMKVTSRLTKAPFKVLPGGQKDFEKFLDRVFNEKKGKIFIKGTSDATVDSAFGHLNVRNLDFDGEIETKGLEGMQHPPPKVTAIKIKRGFPDAVEARTELSIYSPSDVHINLGQLNMMLLYDGHVIGNTTIGELKLAPGVFNSLSVSAFLFANNEHVIDFIGHYISNGIIANSNITLTISGQHPNVTKSKFLEPFLKNLTFQVQAPEFDEEPLLADCMMNILSSTVVMSLRNPFEGIHMSITTINASATYEIYEIGRMVANFEDKGEGWSGPLILPPPKCTAGECEGVVVDSEKIPIMTKKLGYDAIKKALGGSITVAVDSIVGVTIDQFELKGLEYRQSNITAKVRKGF